MERLRAVIRSLNEFGYKPHYTLANPIVASGSKPLNEFRDKVCSLKGISYGENHTTFEFLVSSPAPDYLLREKITESKLIMEPLGSKPEKHLIRIPVKNEDIPKELQLFFLDIHKRTAGVQNIVALNDIQRHLFALK
jgi:hypothetical protein